MTVEDSIPVEPHVFTLSPNAPNPFNAVTTIRYELYRDCAARLTVYDLLGRKVACLAEGHRGAGIHMAVWDGRDDDGFDVSSGVYLYRLTANGISQSGRMTMIR